MAASGRRGGGDRVLESRHLVGLFLGVVLLCGVFFTLGYVMGRNQFGGPVHAAASDRIAPAVLDSPKAKPEAAPAAPAAGEWDFYTRKDQSHLEPAAEKPSVTGIPDASNAAETPSTVPVKMPAVAASRGAKPVAPSKAQKAGIALQLAALKHESDALAMADALQQKGFPSFVVAPTVDSLYRVQVGPYSDEKSAQAARVALDRDGFKVIMKR